MSTVLKGKVFVFERSELNILLTCIDREIEESYSRKIGGVLVNSTQLKYKHGIIIL